MNHPIYLQLFSMTEHAAALNDRYKGAYSGLNSQRVTSQFQENTLLLSNQTVNQQGLVEPIQYAQAKVIIAYRHTDTGELSGTSELLLAASETPWQDMPGLEIVSIGDNQSVTMKLIDNVLQLPKDHLYRIRLAKTLVYAKNFGRPEHITWTDQPLAMGPINLHEHEPSQDITLAPAMGSGLVIKQGQETTSG